MPAKSATTPAPALRLKLKMTLVKLAKNLKIKNFTHVSLDGSHFLTKSH
jgi:hypothetical protein